MSVLAVSLVPRDANWSLVRHVCVFCEKKATEKTSDWRQIKREAVRNSERGRERESSVWMCTVTESPSLSWWSDSPPFIFTHCHWWLTQTAEYRQWKRAAWEDFLSCLLSVTIFSWDLERSGGEIVAIAHQLNPSQSFNVSGKRKWEMTSWWGESDPKTHFVSHRLGSTCTTQIFTVISIVELLASWLVTLDLSTSLLASLV